MCVWFWLKGWLGVFWSDLGNFTTTKQSVASWSKLGQVKNRMSFTREMVFVYPENFTVNIFILNSHHPIWNAPGQRFIDTYNHTKRIKSSYFRSDTRSTDRRPSVCTQHQRLESQTTVMTHTSATCLCKHTSVKDTFSFPEPHHSLGTEKKKYCLSREMSRGKISSKSLVPCLWSQTKFKRGRITFLQVLFKSLQKLLMSSC